MNSDKIHLCIIGCGDITYRAHAPSLCRLKDKVRISFSSRDRKKAHQFCYEFGGEKAYQGIDDMISDPSIDAVSITLPHDQHRDVAVACAKAKKHILLEKPICCTIKEADDIISSVKENNVKLAIAEASCYSRPVIKARELLDQGLIGEFRAIISNQLFMVHPNEWRRNIKQMGGGALIDGGVHTINIFHRIGGKIKTVFALQPPKTMTSMQGEDTIFLTVKFENNGLGQYNYSWASPGAPSSSYYQILGTKGTIFYQNGLFLAVKDREKEEIPVPKELSEGYDWMMEDFIESILNNKEPMMTGEMGKQDLAIALAAYESAKSGQLIPIN